MNLGKERETIAQKLVAIMPRPCQRILLIHPQHIPEEDFVVERALRNRYWSYQPYAVAFWPIIY